MNILFIIIEAKKLVACNINSLPLRVMYNITMGPKKFWIHPKYFVKFPKDIFPYFFTGIVKDFLFLSRTKVQVMTILQFFDSLDYSFSILGPCDIKWSKLGRIMVLSKFPDHAEQISLKIFCSCCKLNHIQTYCK